MVVDLGGVVVVEPGSDVVVAGWVVVLVGIVVGGVVEVVAGWPMVVDVLGSTTGVVFGATVLVFGFAAGTVQPTRRRMTTSPPSLRLVGVGADNEGKQSCPEGTPDEGVVITDSIYWRSAGDTKYGG